MISRGKAGLAQVRHSVLADKLRAYGGVFPGSYKRLKLRGIDVTSAGVYENELFRMFSYPVSGVTIDDAYRSDVMRSPPGCGMRNWRIV